MRAACSCRSGWPAELAEAAVGVHMERPEDYGACMNVNDSDHKPVFAVLQVTLPVYDQVGEGGRGKEGRAGENRGEGSCGGAA